MIQNNNARESFCSKEEVSQSLCVAWMDQRIKHFFNDPNTNTLWYTGLSAVFNTAAVLVAWSTKTESPRVKLIAQSFVSFGMSYSIMHGASDYQNSISYFAASYGFSLMNVWVYSISQQLNQSKDIAIYQCVSVAMISFIVTYFCDKQMRESALSIDKAIDNPLVFLRLWKNFWGKARTGAFSMVGSSRFMSVFVENLSFYEPIIFITLFAIINSQSKNYRLGCPKVDTVLDVVKFMPLLVLLLVAATVIFVFDNELYFNVRPDYNGLLPLLDIIALVIESTGMLLIQPAASSQGVSTGFGYFNLPGGEESKDDDLEKKAYHA